MRIIRKMLKQKCVWWRKTADGDYSGGGTYADPIVIKCRWEDVAEQFVDQRGKERISHSIVYVDRDVSPEDVLMLGDSDDISDSSDPHANDGAFDIKRFDKLPTLKATKYLRTCYL